MISRGDGIRATLFALPGVLLLAGGRSALMPRPQKFEDMGDLIFYHLYPDNWVCLVICSILVCMPATLAYVGAPYLEGVPFARLPLEKTPANIFRVLAYLITILAIAGTFLRFLDAWGWMAGSV